MVLLPLCWLASFGLYVLFTKETWTGWRLKSKAIKVRDILSICFLSFALILTAARFPYKYRRAMGQSNTWYVSWSEGQREAVRAMEQYRGQTHLVATDAPIFPFYANLPGHPYLASASMKRMEAGFLTARDFFDIIQKENPELILFARFPWLRDTLASDIEGRYELEYDAPDEGIWLYVLKTIKRDNDKAGQGEGPSNLPKR